MKPLTIRFIFCVCATLGVAPVAFAQWQPPIGIPAPPFGITNVAPATPNPWASAVPGFYYVNEGAANASDSNQYGTPSNPRRSMPGTLPAGSVVTLIGTYTSNHSGGLSCNGTAANPVYIRGTSDSVRPTITQKWSVVGSYCVIEYVNSAWANSSGNGKMTLDGDYMVVRNVDFRGDTNNGVGGLFPGGSYNVFYKVYLHDFGDVGSGADQDNHCIAIGAGTSYFWLLDSELARCSGDGIQINGESQSSQASTHHLYIGRNVSHHHKQTGFGLKQAVDVIFSQNLAYGFRPGNTSQGGGFAFQYGPERVWVLFNHVHDADYGVFFASTSGLGFGTTSYFVGNVFHDIRDHSSGFNANTAWSSAAFMFADTTKRWIINNTMYDIDGGINIPGNNAFVANSNIIGGLSNRGGKHIFIEDSGTGSSSTLQNTMFGETLRAQWVNGTIYTSPSSFQTATGKGQNSVVAAPQFVNTGGDDYHLVSGSAGTSHGIVDSVYTTFQTLYGLDIRKAADGVARSAVGQTCEVGAFQGSESGGTPTAPAAPTNVRISGQE